MPSLSRDDLLVAELTKMLSPGFPGIMITVAHSKRWRRPCATFRWSGFADLLPEERFQRLTATIPESFREERMGGFVWLELALDESVDEFLQLPRSEDTVDQERPIYQGLHDVGFFKALSVALSGSPAQNCPGDFSQTAAVLSEKSFPAANIRDVKLVFIRHGAYCDCQVLDSVQAVLTERYSGMK